MRIMFSFLLLASTVYLPGCKKNNASSSSGSDADSLDQRVIYKTIATIPSPADSANGLLRDTLSVFRKTYKNDPDFLTNIPNVSSNISNNANGFSFGYDDPGNSLAYFLFSAYAFPDVPRQFVLNKVYEHLSVRGSIYQRPFYLGSHTGFSGMTYFVNNVYPPDASSPSSTTYSRVTFNKLIKIPEPYGIDSFYFGSGHIAGYCIDYYNAADTTRYVHRWDFTVDFTDLRIDP